MAIEPSNHAKDNQDFLRNPSPSGISKAEQGAADDNRPETPRPAARPHALDMAGAFPEGVDDAVMEQLRDWERFSTLAIQIDPPAAGKPSQALCDALTALLTAAARENRALWFHWDGPLYGCVVPGIGQEAAMALALQIQGELAQTRIETVTIGVSMFPLVSFNRAQSMVNACKALDHAAFFGPGSAVIFDALSLNISGDQHYQAGDYGAAIAEYRAALRLDPANVNVLNSLGVGMAKINDLPAARESFQAAVAADPRESMALYNTGLVCQLEGNPDQALDWFMNAYELDDKTFEIPFQIGRRLAEKRQWEKALPFLEKAVCLDAERGAAHNLLGECYGGLNRTAEAIAAYKKAVKLNPNDASALSALGMLYDAKRENPEICLTFCRQSIHLAPRNGLYRKRLAALYRKYDQLEQALDEYEKAASLGEDCCRAIEAVRCAMSGSRLAKQCCA